MEQVIDALKTALPGLLGATSSALVLTEGTIKHRAGVMMMSTATAYYSYEYLAAMSGMPTGLVSFIVGLFAAPIIEKASHDLSKFSVIEILGGILRRLAGTSKGGSND